MQHARLLILVITVLPLVATPGPDVIYIITRGIAQGRRAALVSTVGICTGYAIHTGLAVVGLTALLYASQSLFDVVRYAGAAYLVYLGIVFLRGDSSIKLGSDRRPMSGMRMFLTGMATSVLNPKGILLFLAYFPQFVTAGTHDIARQLFVIGVLFTLMCGVVYGVYALCSGAIGERLSAQPRLANAMKWLSGSVLIGLGVRMALPQRR